MAALFPDRFQYEEELGWVPEGWEVEGFNKFARLDTTSIKPFEQPETLWEHFSIPAFDNGEVPTFDSGETIKSNKYLLHENSVLVSKLNPRTQRVWLPRISQFGIAISSTEFMQFIPIDDSLSPFLYFLIKSRPFQINLLASVSGTTGSRQRAKPPIVAKQSVLLPPSSLIRFFVEKSKSYLDRKDNNSKTIQALTSLRDTLLPKLISGELSVAEAEGRIHSST